MRFKFVPYKESKCGWVQNGGNWSNAYKYDGKGVWHCIGIPGLIAQLRRWLNEA